MSWIRRPVLFLVLILTGISAEAGTKTNYFALGNQAYQAGEMALAAQYFRLSVAEQPSSGALQNLGNANWQLNRTGEAVLAWERAVWVNPFSVKAQNNLRYAREQAQLEAPALSWYEFASTWLPVNWWSWLAGVTLWIAVAALTVPGFLRWPRSSWPQIVAALGLGIFLLCIPAHLGVLTRTDLGIVLKPETVLRLTPTASGERLTSLAAGEPVRKVRTRGNQVFVRTSNSSGWIYSNEMGFICGQ